MDVFGDIEGVSSVKVRVVITEAVVVAVVGEGRPWSGWIKVFVTVAASNIEHVRRGDNVARKGNREEY